MTLVLPRILFTQQRCYTTQNTHTAVLCRVISLQKESTLYCTNNPVCACFYKAESEKEKGWDKHMLFRNQLDSLDNDSSWGTSHHVTDVGPYASITQHNNYNEPSIPCHVIDYLFQFRVYIWGETERTSLQR